MCQGQLHSPPKGPHSGCLTANPRPPTPSSMAHWNADPAPETLHSHPQPCIFCFWPIASSLLVLYLATTLPLLDTDPEKPRPERLRPPRPLGPCRQRCASLTSCTNTCSILAIESRGTYILSCTAQHYFHDIVISKFARNLPGLFLSRMSLAPIFRVHNPKPSCRYSSLHISDY